MIGQRVLLAVALVAGVLAAGIYYGAVQRTAIVFAVRDLAADRAIGPDDVALRELPADSIPVGALRSVEGAIGRVPRAPTWSGQLLLAAALSDGAAAFHSGLSPATGQRAVAIPVSASQALGGALAAGARVDVIAVPVAGRAPSGRATEVVAAAVTVLDVRGENGSPFIVPGTARAGTQSAPTDRLGSIVVALSQTDELRVADRIATSTFVIVFIPARP